jgi:hypothetical protein
VNGSFLDESAGGKDQLGLAAPNGFLQKRAIAIIEAGGCFHL